MKTYTYKAKQLRQLVRFGRGIRRMTASFIPRTISDTGLEQLGVDRSGNRRADWKHPRSQNQWN